MTSKPNSFSDIFPWGEFVHKWEPAVALCVLSPSEKESATQDSTEAFDWCIENGFEFVDLTTVDPGCSHPSAPSNLLSETGDISRIYEALESNLWDGLTRKESIAVTSFPELDDLLPEHEGGTFVNALFISIQGLPSNEDIEFMRKKIFSGADADPFSEIQRLRGSGVPILFLQPSEHAQTLSDAERRVLAAQVALSFGEEIESVHSDEPQPPSEV